jgi:hypothetical protein
MARMRPHTIGKCSCCRPILGGCDQSRASIAASSARRSRRTCAASRLSPIAAVDLRPCFQLARRIRSMPSGVRGPVLVPPCIRQRPLRIAGPRHLPPCRVFAPQRGPEWKSPGGLPFFSHPRRLAWAVSVISTTERPPRRPTCQRPVDPTTLRLDHDRRRCRPCRAG